MNAIKEDQLALISCSQDGFLKIWEFSNSFVPAYELF
jgi:hypothetical protein